jgi:tetratricopeptide (TPR) repeat protein
MCGNPSSRRVLTISVSLLGLMLGPHALKAQTGAPPDASNGAPNARQESPSSPEYDAHVERALAAYDEGRFAEARTAFRQAHELAPTAKTLRTIGMCSFNLGDYLDALVNLEAALVDPNKPLTPAQRSQVSELIAQSQTHVGRFKLRVSPEDATLWVDEAPATRLASGELLLEPGRHELRAQAPGHRAGRSTLQVDGGDRTTLEIRLERQQDEATSQKPALTVTDLETGQTLPTAPAPYAPTQTASESGGAQRALAYAALGIAGAGLATFGVSAGLAAAKEDSLDQNCPDRQCEPAYHDEVDEFDRLKTISTVSLIGAAAFATLGVVLLVTDDAGAPAERASLTPLIGIGSIGLRGSL